MRKVYVNLCKTKLVKRTKTKKYERCYEATTPCESMDRR